MELVDYNDYYGKTVDVDLDAPPSERWDEAVEVFGDELHEFMDEIQAYYYEEGVEKKISQWLDNHPVGRVVLRALISPIGDGLGKLVALGVKLFGQDYGKEIQGIADKAEVSHGWLLLANLLYDISQRGQSACSSYSCNLPGGIPVLGRNMDWDMPTTIGKHTIKIRYHKGRKHYDVVGIVGSVGVLSAIYDNHWAVTLNQGPQDHLPFNTFQMPALMHLRRACDGFGSYKALTDRIQSWQTMCSFFAHAVGTKPTQHTVIAGMGKEYWSRDMDEKYLIQTNHHTIAELVKFNGPDEWEEDGQDWFSDTKPRYRALQRRLDKGLPRSMKTAMEKLERRPVTNDTTMQQMVLCPGKSRLKSRVSV